MAKVTRELRELHKQIIINAAAESFLEKGFTNTTINHIITKLGISAGAFTGQFRTKEDVLYELVGFVLDQQFSVSEKLAAGRTEDKVLLYAVETVLQLYIVELNENLRDVYYNAYSLPKTSALIQQAVTEKVEVLFKEQLPQLKPRDFYLLEIASGGIMRGFMITPCSIWFTMETKVEAFLRNTLRIYYVPDEKIEEAISFVKSIDFEQAARETVDGLFRLLEKQREGLQELYKNNSRQAERKAL
ncbi:MAG: TetR/AcrR family transcriptional regulator [Clostridiales bacterium]|nr:TetR/AcrR family transcriptional regulator [Clostridiales bacterium]